MNRTVYVVTRTERGEAGDYDFSVEVFTTQKAAVEWIEEQIAHLVAKYDLRRSEDVDGWFVMVNGMHHTVQYNLLDNELWGGKGV